MKYSKYSVYSLGLLFSFLLGVQAYGDTLPIFAQLPFAPPSSLGVPLIKDLTNYAPSDGGRNGHCGTSASTLDACQYTHEKKAPFGGPVMAAAPQQGKIARLYCGEYYMNDLKIRLIIGDHYGRHQKKTKYKSKLDKLDICTEESYSETANKINSVQNAQLTLLGRIQEPGVKCKPVRTVSHRHKKHGRKWKNT